MKPNVSKQQASIDYFRRYLERQGSSSSKFPMSITEWEVKPTDHGSIWISARLEHGSNVSENSILRLLDWQSWYVNVGVRGQLTVWSCPKSLQQFAGRRAFGMKFRREVRASYKPRTK